jgi:hypothetical protein
MAATTTQTGTLYIASELGQDKWLLACATQAAQKPRFRSLPARDLNRLLVPARRITSLTRFVGCRLALISEEKPHACTVIRSS